MIILNLISEIIHLLCFEWIWPAMDRCRNYGGHGAMALQSAAYGHYIGHRENELQLEGNEELQ